MQPWLGFVLVQPGQRVQAGFAAASRSFLQASQVQVQRAGSVLQPWLGFVLVQPRQRVQDDTIGVKNICTQHGVLFSK